MTAGSDRPVAQAGSDAFGIYREELAAPAGR